MFITWLFQNPQVYIMWVVMVMFSICFHEFSHAWMALKQGDDTAAANGHLTLNPMVQMGPMSIGLMLIIGIAWGQVPVSPWRMRHRWSHALVSISGPLSNVLLAIIFTILHTVFHVSGESTTTQNLSMFFRLGATLNIVLFIFNMLPVPPLDGHTVFSFLFPQIEKLNEDIRNASMFILFFAVLFLFDKLFMVAGTVVAVASAVMSLPFSG